MLLAGGFARRFGSDKRRHRLRDGTTLLIASVRLYRSVFPHLVVVLRPEDDDLARAVERESPGVHAVRCANARDGMGHSLACGARAAAGWSFLFVALADMPWVAADTLTRLAAAMADGGPDAVVQPVHQGVPGHPVGFGSAWFPQLAALTGDAGARSVVRAAAAAQRLIRLDVDDPGILEDLDTPPPTPP